MTLDWQALFSFSVAPLELVVRGSAIYWFLFAVFRIVLRRDVGAIGVADILLLVLVADAAQNAMAGEYRSISDGIVLVSTIIGWNVAIDRIAFRFPAARRLLEPAALPLVRNGVVLHRNLRREYITVDELRAKLREHGVADLAEVKVAHLESDGEISVLTARRRDRPARRRSRAATGA